MLNYTLKVQLQAIHKHLNQDDLLVHPKAIMSVLNIMLLQEQFSYANLL